jgi:hypothetical protein
MAYERLNLKDGDTLTEAHIAHIEDGISGAMDTAGYAASISAKQAATYHTDKYGYEASETYVYPDGTIKTGKFLAGNTTVKCIVLPASVTEIEAEAFKGCTALETVIVYGHLEKICKMAFENCTSLKTIVYMAKDIYGRPLTAKALGTGAFLNSGLESIDVTTTKTFAASAFKGCNNLRAVHCASLSDWLDITHDGAKSFASMDANPLSLGAELIIGGSRMQNLDLTALAQTTNIAIPNYAFIGGSFTHIKIPRCVTSIGVRAFCSLERSNILDLTDYGSNTTFPTIDGYAFEGKKPSRILVPRGRAVELMNMTNWSQWATIDTVVEMPEKSDSTDTQTVNVPATCDTAVTYRYYVYSEPLDEILEEELTVAVGKEQYIQILYGSRIECYHPADFVLSAYHGVPLRYTRISQPDEQGMVYANIDLPKTTKTIFLSWEV